MPRIARACPGGMIYHVFNHAKGKLRPFRNERDFTTFHDALVRTRGRFNVQILAWCVMKDCWHLVLQPEGDGDLSRFMGYLSLTHSARWQLAHKAVGAGKVYQGRFKSFMVQSDAHLLAVLKYVESTPRRDGIVERAQDWKWSSLRARLSGPAEIGDLVAEWPVQRPGDWTRQINRPQTAEEIAAIDLSFRRSRPFGDDVWVKRVAAKYDLESTLRPRGRPPGWRQKKRNNVIRKRK